MCFDSATVMTKNGDRYTLSVCREEADLAGGKFELAIYDASGSRMSTDTLPLLSQTDLAELSALFKYMCSTMVTKPTLVESSLP